MTSAFFVKDQLDMKAFTMYLYAYGVNAMHCEQYCSVQHTFQKDSNLCSKKSHFLKKLILDIMDDSARKQLKQLVRINIIWVYYWAMT